MTRVITYAVGAVLALLSIFALPWAHYGDIAIPLDRFTGWPVHVVSALALQAIVAWTLFLPDRWRLARLGLGLACGLAAAVSAIVLGTRYDNAGDFFTGAVPLVIPSPGPGPYVAVLAALISVGSALRNRR